MLVNKINGYLNNSNNALSNFSNVLVHVEINIM